MTEDALRSPQVLVDALRDVNAFPEKTENVEFVQTQMSFVFLTDAFAYKIKKPVNLGYLDYTTLDKRLHFCNKELELNRRLAFGVYLAVLPVVRCGTRIAIGGEGEVIEYAVKMKRLPLEQLLDHLLLTGEVTETMVVQIAEKVAAFHKSAASGAEIGKFGELNAIRHNTDENFDQTAKYIGASITDKQYKRIRAFTDGFMQKNESLFTARVSQGRIKDCHGDLHAAHICFFEGITIFDCIEFSDRFRYCDVASEVTFLAMDIDRYGRADLSRAFIDAYVQQSGDTDIYRLLNFYKCYRAYVRGKVESFKLDDPYIADKNVPLSAARTYFSLAERYAREKPVVLLLAGLTGTGKTTVAEALARRAGFVVISSDVVRKNLAHVPLTEHHYADFKSDIYTGDFTRRTYDEMFVRARHALARGQWVILDASFKDRQDRITAKVLAGEAAADLFIAECVLDEHEVKKRLEQRLRDGSVSDGRWEIYKAQKGEFEAITEISPEEHIVVDTSGYIDDTINRILEKVA
ncbi:MAG TPA: hypothetical protein DCX22_03355 [Dehalococcoidia bacterium]|nr:hypothetical protein [Dehalococcoidia bacterium]